MASAMTDSGSTQHENDALDTYENGLQERERALVDAVVGLEREGKRAASQGQHGDRFWTLDDVVDRMNTHDDVEPYSANSYLRQKINDLRPVIDARRDGLDAPSDDDVEYRDETPVIDLEVGQTPEHTVDGGWYHGVVNGVEDYGVFVTLAQAADGDRVKACRGLAHESQMPFGYRPRHYSPGDAVVVERIGTKDGKLTLRMVSAPDGEIVVGGPVDAPATDPVEAAGFEEAEAHAEPEPTDRVVVALDPADAWRVVRDGPREASRTIFEQLTREEL